jgi:O-antigen/teichoic acid export membrane protein
MHREGRHILSHAAIYLAARGLPGVIAFLAIPLFSRMLDPEGYGRYALALGAVNVAHALVFQWLRLSLVRYLPGAGEDRARLKSTLATTCAVLVLGVGILVAAACLLPAARGWRAVMAMAWAVLALQAAFELCCEYARGSLRPWHYMRLQVVRSSAFVVLGAVFVAAGAGWWGPLAGVGGGMLVAVALAWNHDWAGVRPVLDRPLLGRLVRYGVPLSLTVALTVVISTSDRYLIAWLRGEAAAGVYSVAVDFTSQTLTLLMMVIHLAMFPIAVRAWEDGGPQAAGERMRDNAALLLAVGVPCVVGLTVLAPGIAQCFLGREFRRPAADVIPLVALGTFLAGFKAFHFDAAFQFAHRTLSQVWIVLAAAVVNFALNVIAIPRWGLNGAAGASVAAFVVAIGLTIVVGRRHVRLPIDGGAFAAVLAAGVVMGLLLYPVRRHVGPPAVAAQVAGGALVYGAVLLAFDFLGLRTQLLRAWKNRLSSGAPPAGARLAPATSEVA